MGDLCGVVGSVIDATLGDVSECNFLSALRIDLDSGFFIYPRTDAVSARCWCSVYHCRYLDNDIKDMKSESMGLLRNVRLLTWLFIIGLIISGVTAIPLPWELDLLTRWLGISELSPATAPSALAKWLLIVRDGLNDTNARYPFSFYGMDWLAFGHVAISIAFLGAVRDPIRNAWLYDFGLIACVLVIPWAFIFGQVRGIPWGWRLIDCSFGIFGLVPLWLCRRWINQCSDTKSKNGDAR